VFIQLITVLSLISLSSALASPNSSSTQVGAATAKKELLGTSRQNSAGAARIYLYWPRGLLDPGWLDNLKSDVEIVIDDKKVGTMASGDYIITQIPTGYHAITFRSSLLSIPIAQNHFFVGGANTSHYYRIREIDINSQFQMTDFQINETSEEFAIREIKELRRR
jgi:hypothetical protein